MRHWLMKSEPDVFGIAHLQARGEAPWDGVRNYQARNNLRAMAVGDAVVFHHSSAHPVGLAGLARVTRAAYPDPTAVDPASSGFDPKSKRDAPRWDAVDVAFVEAFPRIITMDELRAVPALAHMVLLNNTRLSVQPMTAAEYAMVTALGRGQAALGGATRGSRARRAKR